MFREDRSWEEDLAPGSPRGSETKEKLRGGESGGVPFCFGGFCFIVIIFFGKHVLISEVLQDFLKYFSEGIDLWWLEQLSLGMVQEGQT